MNYMPVVMGDRHGGAGRAPVVNSVAEGLWVHNMANTTVGIAASVAARRENPRYPSNLAWESRLVARDPEDEGGGPYYRLLREGRIQNYDGPELFGAVVASLPILDLLHAARTRRPCTTFFTSMAPPT